MFTKVSQESEAAVHASYVLSEMIAKHSKPFTEGDFIKECLIKAAEIVCPGSVKTFQAISLSRNTVVERVTDMARNLNDQIKEKSSCFEAFSIAFDESTDIGCVAQLAVFFRACDTDFNIFEELLELIPMHGTTTGEDIFNCVYDLLQKYNLPQSKLTSVATDGAPSMTGKTNGFVALLRKKLSEISDGSNIHHTHCIIHQEVLCTKVIKMENVLTPIKKFINFIRSRGLNQRQFSLFLTELESEYSGLSYYTEVGWLSCSKVLKQFWDLKEEICQFLITKNQDITLFSDQVWLQDFSFMVDITKHLSDLNLKLQGKDHIITNMCDQVNAFKCKLVLWEKQLKNEDLMHFPTCNMYKSSLGETASYQKYAEKILSLRNEFETRFSDFKSLEGKFTLFSSIFSINIESVPNHMQMEVIDIQCDSDLKAKFIEVGVSEFYKYLPARFENIRKLAYEIMSMFGNGESVAADMAAVSAAAPTAAGPTLYEFLLEAELAHYYQPLATDLKVGALHQLKYVTEEDLQQLGMTRPEQRRLRKFFHKYHPPHSYLHRIKKDCTTLEQRAVIRFLNAEGIQTSNMPRNEKYLWSQRSAGKVLLTIFWDVVGPICLDFLSSRQRMNSDLYCDILVNKLKPGIRNKRRGKLSVGVLFLHDNARPHTSCKTVSTIIKLSFEVLEHPEYSPDLSPSDYFLFGLLKKELKGKRFDSDEDVQKVVQDFFHTLPKSAYKEGIYKLPERWRRCIESQGNSEMWLTNGAPLFPMSGQDTTTKTSQHFINLVLLPYIVRIPLDPMWTSWNKVRPGLTKAISQKPWSLGGRFSVRQNWRWSMMASSFDMILPKGREDQDRSSLLIPEPPATDSRTAAASTASRNPSRHIISPDSIAINKQLGVGEFGVVEQGVWTNEDGERSSLLRIPWCTPFRADFPNHYSLSVLFLHRSECGTVNYYDKPQHLRVQVTKRGSDTFIQVAIKCLSKEKLQNNNLEFLKEAAIMHSINHEHIVRLYGVVLDTSSLMLVTELAPLRSLLECLKEPAVRSSFPVSSLCDFSLQVCQGMSYLEAKRLIHRDLAARNILVFGKNKVKISDFGLSRALGVGKDYYQTNFNVNLKLPIAWCAPECINFLKFTSASDVWAYGVTLWEMFSYGFQPWAALTGQQILEAIDEPNFQRLEQPECCPKDYYNLMLRCWQHDLNKRPRFADLLSLLPEVSTLDTFSGAVLRLYFAQTPKCKPEQVQAVKDFFPGPGKTKKEMLQYRTGEVITVLDNKPLPEGIAAINCQLWKGCLPSGKTGLFNPGNTVAYLGRDLPGAFTRPTDSKTASLYASRRRLCPEMISRPKDDLRHTGHVGLDGAFFGDVTFLGDKYHALPKQIVTPYKPQDDKDLVRVPSDLSDKTPLLVKSNSLRSDSSTLTLGVPDLAKSPDDLDAGMKKSKDGKKNGLDHEYHEISDEEGQSPKFEGFDLGPSFYDEVFKALTSSTAVTPASPELPVEELQPDNVRNEIKELASKLTCHKKKHVVKPISSNDEHTLDSAIAMAKELATKSMLEQDEVPAGLKDPPVESPKTPNTPTKKKFPFIFKTSPKVERRNFSQEAESIASIQDSLSESAREAYASLVEKSSVERSLISHPLPGSLVLPPSAAPPQVAPTAGFDPLQDQDVVEQNPLRALRQAGPVRPRVRGNKSIDRSAAPLRQGMPPPPNPLPLPPRDRTKPLPVLKHHERKHPLILPANPTCLEAHTNQDEAFERHIEAELDSLDDIPDVEPPSPPIIKRPDHVSCEDLMEFAMDKPNAKR
ncbi:hypothetical protein LAZ67_8001602 [Cordylochernes scorpioides]|uniref:non-specific protein-tyrosine kinase n=1 Tax=Cordylochernes scorpioides TaxID=51811 RepID=A0ABY6KT66_9ARAC|nr:hypothetical protein LAZ67_8001602 [Cordylochernes scorpioides]